MRVLALLGLALGLVAADNGGDDLGKMLQEVMKTITDAFSSASDGAQQGFNQMTDNMRNMGQRASSNFGGNNRDSNRNSWDSNSYGNGNSNNGDYGVNGGRQMQQGNMGGGMGGHGGGSQQGMVQWAMDFMERQTPDCGHRGDRDVRRAFPDCHDSAARDAGLMDGAQGGGPMPEPDPSQMEQMKQGLQQCMQRQLPRQANEEFLCQLEALDQMMQQHMGGGGGPGMDEGGPDGMVHGAIRFMDSRTPDCEQQNGAAIRQAFPRCHDEAMRAAGMDPSMGGGRGHHGGGHHGGDDDMTPQQMDEIKRAIEPCMSRALPRSAQREFQCKFAALSDHVDSYMAMKDEVKRAKEEARCDTGYDEQIHQAERPCHRQAFQAVMGPMGPPMPRGASNRRSGQEPMPEPEPDANQMRRMYDEMKPCMREQLGGGRAYAAFECAGDASLPIMIRFHQSMAQH